MAESTYKYFAFISYNSKDTEWGKKLQKKLEHYRLPSTLCSEHGWKRKPMNPVFFAPTDIQPGGLTEELQERLRASRHLIVICSPNSAQSEWVGKEITFFHSLGRTKNIHFFIVDGIPHSGDTATECFNPVVEELELPEILGANIHEKVSRLSWLNRERAYVQLISKLLGVEFDTIWKRHRRMLVRRAVVWTIGGVVIISTLFFVWRKNQPFDVEVRLKEALVHNDNLPPLKDAIVTLSLDNETKSDTIRVLNGSVIFRNIPHRYLNKKARLKVSCPNFINTDEELVLTSNLTLNIHRNDSVFGFVSFRLYNVNTETYINNAKINIAGQEVVSDSNGHVSMFIPLEKQQQRYVITSSVPLENDTVYMPQGNNDAVLVK